MLHDLHYRSHVNRDEMKISIKNLHSLKQVNSDLLELIQLLNSGYVSTTLDVDEGLSIGLCDA